MAPPHDENRKTRGQSPSRVTSCQPASSDDLMPASSSRRDHAEPDHQPEQPLGLSSELADFVSQIAMNMVRGTLSGNLRRRYSHNFNVSTNCDRGVQTQLSDTDQSDEANDHTPSTSSNGPGRSSDHHFDVSQTLQDQYDRNRSPDKALTCRKGKPKENSSEGVKKESEAYQNSNDVEMTYTTPSGGLVSPEAWAFRQSVIARVNQATQRKAQENSSSCDMAVPSGASAAEAG